jgi:small conductance mechanosensitive channel
MGKVNINYLESFLHLVLKNLPSLIAAFVAFFLIILLGRVFTKTSARFANKIDTTLTSFVKNIVRLTFFVIAIITSMHIAGVPLSPILTVLGSVTIAIGLAFQASLSNIASGVMMVIFRPHKVGDFVQFDNGDIMGTINKIDLFFTEITHFDGKIITLPNSKLTTSIITNYTNSPVRRIDIKLFLSPTVQSIFINKIAFEVINKIPDVLYDLKQEVIIHSIERDSVVFNIRFWVKSEAYWDSLFLANRLITESLQLHNIVLQPQIFDLKEVVQT